MSYTTVSGNTISKNKIFYYKIKNYWFLILVWLKSTKIELVNQQLSTFKKKLGTKKDYLWLKSKTYMHGLFEK